MKMLLWALLGGSIVSMTACGEKEAEICNDSIDNDGNGLTDCYDDACTTDATCVDADGDGFVEADDCNDQNALSYPGANEICDEDDNNCNGEVDEDPIDGRPFYGDADLDGFGDPAQLLTACSVSEGVADNADDCDDGNADIHPNATEVCDEVDNNCDNVVDYDATDRSTFYRDIDGDGYGISAGSQTTCFLPEGFAEQNGDCDDGNPDANPGATETCDGIDNDCDGTVDVNATDGADYYADMDGDGFGDPNMSVSACAQPDQYVTDNTDCDDTTSFANPNALEVCDGIDNDCDGTMDDDDSNVITASGTDWYPDLDGDGQGDDSVAKVESCLPPVDSVTGNVYVDNRDDCDDLNVSIYAGAPEICNGGIDDDCDGIADDKAEGGSTYYPDADGDGVGDSSVPMIACSDPSTTALAYVTIGGDCNDEDAAVYPNAMETCDGVDNNCSGDENDATGTTMFYLDADGDGQGNSEVSVSSCVQPDGYVTNSDDCDDADDTVFVGAPEVCDTLDNDCDGLVDQADTADFDPDTLFMYYADQDQDGYGNESAVVYDCSQPAGYVTQGGDCNDSRQLNNNNVMIGSLYNPGLADTWYDGVDSDCAGNNDYDQDGDGELAMGLCSDTSITMEYECVVSGDCSIGSYDNEMDCGLNGGSWSGNTWTGFNVNGTDCDDTNANKNNVDVDGDGYSTCQGDCNEDMTVVPGYGTIGENTYPGAGYAEADPNICTTDMDGDGLGGTGMIGCLDFALYDSWGDGWNGNALDVYEDGVFVESLTNQNLDGVSNNGAGGEYNYLSYCPNSSTLELSLVFNDGSYNTEISFEIMDDSGAVIATGQGTGTYDVIVNGVTYTDGDTVLVLERPAGSDCDDFDAAIGSIDADNDGAIDCSTDCDPTDPNLNDADNDQDGFTSCGGDCNDNDPLINPDATEVPYNGIDENCDGINDYDQDGDGDDDVAYGGTDCDDSDPTVNGNAVEVCDGEDNDCDGLTDEADPSLDTTTFTTYYEDLDGDGFGNDATATDACDAPTIDYIEQGGDCNDDPNLNGQLYNPDETDIAYNGIDENCDGLNDFDADGDGEVAAEIDCAGVMATSCDVDGDGTIDFVGGTDCDDSNASMISTDMDGDGISVCAGDCNEDMTLAEDGITYVGSYTYPGAAYNESTTDCLTDMDGDGYAGFGVFGCYDFTLFDTYGDGWNGNAIEVYEDGVMTASIANQNLDGISSNTGGEYNYTTFCPDPATQSLEFYFNDGSYNSEVEFQMVDASGALILDGVGSGTTNLIVNGVTYTDGDLIYTGTVPQGNDCDDTDPSINLEDNDGDGVSACAADCDDNDPLNAGTFAEDCFDGQDNDCDGLADALDSDCMEADCADGQDNDFDGLLDCADPDCASALGCTETVCNDQQDDDGDGLMDCYDPDCADAAVCQFACVDESSNDLGSALGMGVASGNNMGMQDNFQGECTMGMGAEDVAYMWTAPFTATYTFQTSGSNYDTVLLLQDSCASEAWACNDDVDFDNGDSTSIVEAEMTAGESVVIIIDGYEEYSHGDHSLDIFLSNEVDCTDGQDEDADGAVDCADFDCADDAACASSTCPSFDIGTDTGVAVLVGDLSQAPIDNFQATCSTEGGNDLVVSWQATTTGCATFSTESGSMDTILAVFDACPDAGGVEMACNDDYASSIYTSEIQYNVMAGEVYYIGIDSWVYSQSDVYSLDISVQAGHTCN